MGVDIAPNKSSNGPIAFGVRTLAGGIGLASESLKVHKEHKAAARELRNAHKPGTSTTLSTTTEINTHIEAGSTETLPPYSVDRTVTLRLKTQTNESLIANEYSGQVATQESISRDDHGGALLMVPREHSGELVQAPEGVALLGETPPPSYTEASLGKLPRPVVVPQRRPKTRTRGFVRAYAPDLEHCGIDQAMWFNFLDDFHKSSMASPWMFAINAAAIVTAPLPGPIGLTAGTAFSYMVYQASRFGEEMQGRERTNRSMRKFNDEFFHPRGLHCLVMTYDPDSSQMFEKVDINSTIASRSVAKTGVSNVKEKYRSSDACIRDETHFPETAPLVFPSLGESKEPDSKTRFKGLAKKRDFVNDYYDRRATARYAMKHPNTPMATVPYHFNSRYGDPNNAATNGSFSSFVTTSRQAFASRSQHDTTETASVVEQAEGDMFEIVGTEFESSQDKSKKSEKDTSALDDADTNVKADEQGEEVTKVKLPNKKKFLGKSRKTYSRAIGENVLYLMVVNMPSEEEMNAAAAASDAIDAATAAAASK